MKVSEQTQKPYANKIQMILSLLELERCFDLQTEKCDQANKNLGFVLSEIVSKKICFLDMALTLFGIGKDTNDATIEQEFNIGFCTDWLWDIWHNMPSGDDKKPLKYLKRVKQEMKTHFSEVIESA